MAEQSLSKMGSLEFWLKILPPRPGSYLTRYALTTAMVIIAAGLIMLMNRQGGYYSFFIFFFVIFLSSILFDHMSGFVATAESTVIMYFQLQQPDTGVFFEQPVPLLTMFVASALGVAIISEGLRKAWEVAVEAERRKDLLLEELRHRTKNDMAMVVSVLSLQARAAQPGETKSALETAMARIRAISGVHNSFGPVSAEGRVDIKEYLGTLCNHLTDTVRGLRPIRIELDVESVVLDSKDALPLGLIVNELVTNALKYAFPGDREGVVRVTLTNQARSLIVEDNGVGLADDAASPSQKSGIGTRLTGLLARQLGGTITWEAAQPGCRVRVELERPVRA